METKVVESTPSSNPHAGFNWIVSIVNSLLSIANSNKAKSKQAQPSSSSSSSSSTPKTLIATSQSSNSNNSNSISISSTSNGGTVTTISSPPPSTTPSLSLKSKDLSSTEKIPAQIGSPSSQKKKTLILDLDETLVHSTIKPVSTYHMTVDVVLEGVQCTFFVIKRPHVDSFLQQVAEWYECVVFTASMKQYADPLLDQLDPKRSLFKGRLFRDSCLYKEGSFIKDLTLIGQDLTSTIIIDNSPIAYSHNRENALPIDNWLGDNPSDQSLLNLLPFLDALRFTQDVRSILSLSG
eukprot:TRINITY_DN2048_c0_g2_i1.p1 TRINITY_DN2048_c0_g2~~TRINITY_DN2048_c0_g2_i1.p1  ORF type:complete len:294 (-),score=66.49 TRINITY_DN2048_c0_g2_i1:226-1107(-)